MNTRLGLVALVASQLLAADVARAEDEMSTFKANVEGAGWLFPTLTLHTVLHEGSHAVAASVVGAHLVQIRWLPGRGRLATTGWLKRNKTVSDVAFVTVAPQITNLATLTAYSVLHELGVPSNEHVRLPLMVMAFWAWSDLAVQLVPFRGSETENAYRYLRLKTWQTIPFRAVHLGVVLLGYHYLRRGYDSIFDEQTIEAAVPKVMVPLSFKF